MVAAFNIAHIFFISIFISVSLCLHNSPSVTQMLSALEKIVSYFEDNPLVLNVDGLFGLRVAQGQLLASQSEAHKLLVGDFGQRVRIGKISKAVEHLGHKTMARLRADNSHYYTSFMKMVSIPFRTRFNPFHLNVLKSGNDSGLHQSSFLNYNESRGDKCYELLMGSELNTLKMKCYIDVSCLQYMAAKNQHGYALTHQMIYFLMAQHFRCTHVLELVVWPRSIPDILRQLCTGILADYLTIGRDGRVPIRLQDLFLEQGMLCSILGYDGFFSTSSVHMVLSWQDTDSGCYRLFNRQYVKPRHKRKDIISTGGCSAHKTGLAAGYLASSIRHKLHKQLFSKFAENP